MAEASEYQKEIEKLKQRLTEIESPAADGIAATGAGRPSDAARVEAPDIQPQPLHTQPSGSDISDQKIASAIRTAQKPIVSQEREVGSEPESPWGPVGLDVGTSNIVMAQNKGNKIQMIKQLNAFFTIPQSKFTKQILTQNNVMFFEHNKRYYIIGYSAEGFANMFNSNTRKSMEKGLLSPREDEAVIVIQSIINTLIQKPKKFGEIICFSVPGQPIEREVIITGHESIIKMYLETLGYMPVSINEGLAVVMSELSEDNFTGIGISMGGGMCNVCLSYLSVPVVTYSIQKGGDYIDEMTSLEVGEPATKIKVVKEESLDLSVLPKNKLELSMHLYYNDLINHLVRSIQDVITSSDHIPKITEPIPIVLSGGTSMPKGCREKFEKALNAIRLPIEISSVRVAREPLNATAKGALVMAMAESR
ncbi:hypothetical protein [Candidatus Magnetominusculus dajiuhuensis]|uniref:hypothetical protein n=1 Tax=Candidatus Magnetominusculus dajiuhuensis TaxID=3137712 RepID=UPI003B43B841